jgi:hypothetical protein
MSSRAILKARQSPRKRAVLLEQRKLSARNPPPQKVASLNLLLRRTQQRETANPGRELHPEYWPMSLLWTAAMWHQQIRDRHTVVVCSSQFFRRAR